MTVVPSLRRAKAKPIEEGLWRRMEASWAQEFGAEGEASDLEDPDESVAESDVPREITCANCGASGSSDRTSATFDFRGGPLGGDPVRKCVACGTGLFIVRGGGGRTDIVPSGEWAKMEMLHQVVFGSDEDSEEEPVEKEHAMTNSGATDAEMLAGVRRFLTEDEWPFQELGDGALASGFTGENGSWRVSAHASADSGFLVLYSVLNDRVPESRRQAVSELLTRANYGLIVGNFELDLSDGEVRFKTSVDVKETLESLTSALIEHLVYDNVLQVDRYYPAIMAVVHGGRSPQEAAELVDD